MNRVAITGIGVISPIGQDIATIADAMREARGAIRSLTGIPLEALNIKIGAEITDFDPEAQFSAKQLPLLDRSAQLAVAASRLAVAAAGLNFRESGGARSAVILGSGVGGMTTLDASFQRFYEQGNRRAHPFTVPKLMISAPASHITMEHGITGPSFTTASACASSNHAIGTAFHMVRSGMVDAALTGGTEAVFTLGAIKAWEALRVMAPDSCRPFSRGRLGMVLGEGAGVFVLENYERAKARGAEMYGEMIGFGMSSDAADIVLPSCDGAIAAIRACLADAKLNPEDVDYINAHGTGTLANDVTETRAIRTVFKDHADRLPVSSTKAMHGHALGAAGALELAMLLIAMRENIVPATINYVEPDPDCDLDVVPNRPRQGKIGVALSNSFAFGGQNAVLAIKRA